MSLTWGQMRKRYLSSVGDIPSADAEAWQHLTEGLRRLCRHVDVPELQQIATVTLSTGDHYFDMDCDAFTIRSIFNCTDGIMMHREEGGFAGRQRYIDPAAPADPKPFAGSPTHWVRTGNRIYVRGTCEASTVIQVHYEVQPEPVDVSDIDSHAITPAQYDTVIVHFAVSDFYTSHAMANRPRGESTLLPSAIADRAAFSLLDDLKKPLEIETRAERGNIRLAGFQMTPRSRRGRRR